MLTLRNGTSVPRPGVVNAEATKVEVEQAVNWQIEVLDQCAEKLSASHIGKTFRSDQDLEALSAEI